MNNENRISDINRDGFYQESSPLQRSSTRFASEQCLFAGRTGFAETVIITNPDYGRMLFLDGELQSCKYDESIYHETLVHPIMRALDHIDDKRILVVGGAEGATVREVLKWGPNKVRRVDWVDIDRPLMRVCRQYLQYATDSVYNNPKVHFYARDIMDFLLNRRRMYDCIIIDLPDPDPAEPVLYGSEFWRRINAVLRGRGGIVTHCGPLEPGLGRQEGLDIIRALAGTGYAYHTLIPSFQGEWGFWMSLPPCLTSAFPDDCSVITNHFQSTIFHWDRHWMVR
jgi:spermidine synthase